MIPSRPGRIPARRVLARTTAWIVTGCAAPLISIALIGCSAPEKPESSIHSPARPPARPITFTDITQQAGISFVHVTGAFGKKYLPETMGSGLAFLDYDGDGREDLFFVNGAEWPGHRRQASRPALYRNRGDGTFEDVTLAAGLEAESYGIGAAAADYDGDGRIDLFVNALGPDRLYRNAGGGRFEDVTAKAGVSDPAFGSSATWLDYDGDGRLDLFVGNYVQWSEAGDIFCTLDGVNKSYCTPESYRGATNRLFRNRGDGTFEDVSRRAGVLNPTGKSLGVAALDYDGDGWTDLAVANDTQPNFLYHNRRDGTFEEVGVQAGVGFGEDGRARGAMGIDAADYDGSGRESLVIGNFSNEMVSLYRNLGNGVFLDEAPAAGVGTPSLLTLAFGCFFFDYDLDAQLDILVANGHVENDIERIQPTVTYAQPPHLFRGIGGGRFEEVTSSLGPSFTAPRVARGAAYADIDGDGDLDVAISINGGPAVLWRNDGGGEGADWIRIRLKGASANLEAIGAKVVVRRGPASQTRWVRSASSYASQSETTLTFGLGAAPGGGTAATVEAEVTWPGGAVQHFPSLEPRKLHVLEKAAR
jgi:hypothetical protein